MLPEKCKVGSVVQMDNCASKVIGKVIELDFQMNDHCGLVPSAKVQWKGWQPAPDSWENVSDLIDFREELARVKEIIRSGDRQALADYLPAPKERDE